ncbi:MAG TPA: hypothetical protein VEX68_21215 [Bryobacteraceae bacterium]|nr:hypothetical protein [Bryobacteraceae bacterium]
MRIERSHICGLASVPARTRETVAAEQPESGDIVSLRFEAQTDRVSSIRADTYDPQPADIADALLERGFDR